MTRRDVFLCAVLAVELLVGAALYQRQRARPTPPRADLSFVHPLAAGQLTTLIDHCVTPTDWANLGKAYLALGYFSEGEACYRHAAAAEPRHPVRAYEWAFALERLGLLADANREYERAAHLGLPRPDDCWYLIGRNCLRTEDASAAQAAFVQAGSQPSARYERARLLARAGKTAEATAILDRLTAEFPDALQPYLLRHRIELLNASPAASVDADKAARAPGRLPTPFDDDWKRLEDTYDRLGLPAEWLACRHLIARGNVEAAAARLESALHQQWDPLGAELLAETMLQRHRPQDAIPHLQNNLERAGPSVHLLTRLGHAHEQTGQTDRAVDAWARAVHLGIGADVKEAHAKLASYYQRIGNGTAARQHNSLAHLATGHESFWNGHPSAALPSLELAVQAEPHLAAAWFYIGEVERLAGRSEVATKAYRRCLVIDPDCGRAHAGLGLVAAP